MTLIVPCSSLSAEWETFCCRMTAFGPFPRRHRNGQFSSVLARSTAAAPSSPSLPLHPGSRAGVGGTKVFEPRLTNSGRVRDEHIFFLHTLRCH